VVRRLAGAAAYRGRKCPGTGDFFEIQGPVSGGQGDRVARGQGRQGGEVGEGGEGAGPEAGQGGAKEARTAE
jgi:hypothetical protein